MVEVVRTNYALRIFRKIQIWTYKTNVALPCGIVQMSLQTFERPFLPLKKAKIRIKIGLHMATISQFEWLNLWCANPLFKFNIQSETNKKQELPTFLSHAAVQRRIYTKLCTKIEDICTIFAPLDFFNRAISFGARELRKIFFWGGNDPSRIFAYKFLIYQPNRTKCWKLL